MLKKCPDCDGELEEGSTLDFTYGGIIVERYGKVKVPRESKMIWTSEANFQDIRRTITYRCTKCNRLFSYAQDVLLGSNVRDANRNQFKVALIIMGVIFGFAILIPIILSLIGQNIN